MGTIVCFMFCVPLCTPEGEPKAPDVPQSGKMFYRTPVLTQNKADGLLHINCIGSREGTCLWGFQSCPFPSGSQCVTIWEIFLNQCSTCPFQSHIQRLFNFINVLVVIKEHMWCPWPFWKFFCRIL